MEAENDVSTTQHADSHQKLEGMDPLPECAEHGTTDILTLDFRTVREYISVIQATISMVQQPQGT